MVSTRFILANNCIHKHLPLTKNKGQQNYKPNLNLHPFNLKVTIDLLAIEILLPVLDGITL